jgi:2,5-diamino-6-(ribosylamino)-4(3H)-pyrimidinone 5'-phosphate reductase
LRGKILRLYPAPLQDLPAGGIYEDLELPPPERTDRSRPYVIINMVSSVDGKTTIEGKSSPIGSQTDRQAMRILRSKCDAVMVGAGTLRAEKLSLKLDDAFGAPQPLAIIVTSTGEVSLNSNLIGYEGQNVLVITTEAGPESRASRLCESARLLRAPTTASGDVDLENALRILQCEYAVDVLLVEGGPSLNHSLVSKKLVDELFLTLAPKLLGGPRSGTLTLLEGTGLSPSQSPKVVLVSVHLSGDELYLRYRFVRPGVSRDERAAGVLPSPGVP